MFFGRLLRAPVPAVPFLLLVVLGSGCVGPVDTTIDTVFDPCEALGLSVADDTTEAERQAVTTGAAFWNDRALTRLSLGSDAAGPVLPVEFQPAALAFRGLYDDENGIVFVNRRIEDPTVLAITLAHEVGHAFGLVHVSPDERRSIMNPGNITVTPTEEDVAALARIWGTCAR